MDKPALSVKEACTYLGIGKSTLYRARAQGDIDFRKIFGRTVVIKADLDALLRSRPIAQRGSLRNRA